MKTYKIAVCLVLGVAIPLQESWERPSEDYAWSFPKDHWAHESFRTEWWYATGFLESDTDASHRFAYQLTFFRIGVTPQIASNDSRWAARDILMGHAAVTNLTDGTHRFSEIFYRAAPLLSGFGTFPDSTIAWARSAPGSGGEWHLRTDGTSFTTTMRDDNANLDMNLRLHPTKPLVFQGPNGFSRKNAAGTAASMYYTFPRLRVDGSITIDGTRADVHGTGWMDREFSSGTLSEKQIGWDWFGLQLDDGRDIMVYILRDSAGTRDYGHATVIDESGTPTYLSAPDWSLQSTNSWKSEATGIVYPMGWRLSIDAFNIDVELAPMSETQENVSAIVSRLNYWEGAVAVFNKDGTQVGRGFAELTGYGGSRPAV